MTYRVVQVTEDHLDGTGDGGAAVSVVSTAAFAGAPQAVAQVLNRPHIENGYGQITTVTNSDIKYNVRLVMSALCLLGCYPEPFQ